MNAADTPSVQLRTATAENAAPLPVLVAPLGCPATPQQARQRLARIQGSPDYHTVVAECDGEVLELVGVQRGWGYEHDRPFVRVLALDVRADARGRGAGTRLTETADACAGAHGAHAVHLATSLHREEAHRFYEGLGFSRSGWRCARAAG